MKIGKASFDELGQRLQAALKELETGSKSGQWRGLLDDLLRHVWFLTGRMDTRAAWRGLEALRPSLQIARRFTPLEEPARTQAARALEEAETVLSLAAAAAKPTELLVELRSRTPTTAAVLDVLGRQRRFMRRGEVYLAVRQNGVSVSRPRVSQILGELHRDGFLLRQFGPGQGAREVAHYALSEEGRAVWEEASAPPGPMETATARELELQRENLALKAENQRLKAERDQQRVMLDALRPPRRQPVQPFVRSSRSSERPELGRPIDSVEEYQSPEMTDAPSGFLN
jgi:DNA-binding PadR family transcriptional regulator